MRKLLEWCKREIVFTIALVLAIISAFFIHPDKEYIGYIDFRTLAILFCLMAVMAGLQKIGLFRFVAEMLLKKMTHIRGLIFILIMLCFFSSMLITNDVALITFVPFTFIVLKMILKIVSDMMRQQNNVQSVKKDMESIMEYVKIVQRIVCIVRIQHCVINVMIISMLILMEVVNKEMN